jgi:hypothetical protein
MATESITKKVIVKGVHDIIPNYVAGGMDATEGTYVWNYTTRNCPEEEWEELYKGKLGDPGRRGDHIGYVRNLAQTEEKIENRYG